MRDNALYLAWLLAMAASVLLYFAGQVPDKGSWFGLIALVPLAIILGLAAFRGDVGVRRYALPVVAIGAVITLARALSGAGEGGRETFVLGLSYSAFSAVALLVIGALLGIATTPAPDDDAPLEEPQAQRAFSAPLAFAAAVAVIALLGSLYFSEVRLFVPCTLCWYQRIFMYALAVMLPIAAARGEVAFARYALPLSVTGGLIAIWHVLEERIPALAKLSSAVCAPGGVPCDLKYVEYLGFITIPVMSLTAFVLITVALLLARRSQARRTDLEIHAA
nr:disulfide oxidoreductase [Deinobacterium chartae]